MQLLTATAFSFSSVIIHELTIICGGVDRKIEIIASDWTFSFTVTPSILCTPLTMMLMRSVRPCLHHLVANQLSSILHVCSCE